MYVHVRVMWLEVDHLRPVRRHMGGMEHVAPLYVRVETWTQTCEPLKR